MAHSAPASAPASAPTGDATHADLVAFLRACHRTLVDLGQHLEADDPIRRGAGALAAALGRAEPRSFATTRVPVVDSVDRLPTDEHNRALVEAFLGLADRLPWVPTHRASDEGRELGLAPLNEVLDLGDTTVGLMYVGAGSTYPLHHHPPQELYLTIAGTGRWRWGGREQHQAETVRPRAALYNHPDDLHTAAAGQHPILALYVLW